MINQNRHNQPVAPLQGEYQAPGLPRHSLPGTKAPKERAGNVALSLACSVVFVVVWRLVEDSNLHQCFVLLFFPLGMGIVWPALSVLQDWLITVHLARHSYTYNTEQQKNGANVRRVNREWSNKHNTPSNNKQVVTVTHRSKEEELEAENRRLLQVVAKMRGGLWDLDTTHLEDVE